MGESYKPTTEPCAIRIGHDDNDELDMTKRVFDIVPEVKLSDLASSVRNIMLGARAINYVTLAGRNADGELESRVFFQGAGELQHPTDLDPCETRITVKVRDPNAWMGSCKDTETDKYVQLQDLLLGTFRKVAKDSLNSSENDK